MGTQNNFNAYTYPVQSENLGKIVEVCFNYDRDATPVGTIIRDDMEAPFETIIQLTDGRIIRGCECQYRFI